MEPIARLNYLRMSPRKVRIVASILKGKSVERALLELRHLPKHASRPLEKLLASAIANAKHNHQLESRTLYVKEVRVDEGPTLKRFMPRAFGRSAPIRKRTSHVRLVLGVRGVTPVAPTGHSPRSGIEVRDASPDEVKGEVEVRSKPEKSAIPKAPRTRSSDFVRRVFRRKAI